jgi:hypothetical protein
MNQDDIGSNRALSRGFLNEAPFLVFASLLRLFLTTEAQSTQRVLIFPWPGDDGQGKEPPPAAKAL